MRLLMSKYKIVAACSLGTGALFGALSLTFYFGDWQRLALLFCMGLLVGLLAAPVLDPKLFKNPGLFQSIGGALAGALAGAAIQPNPESIVAGLFVGGVIGWLTPWWLKHIQIP